MKKIQSALISVYNKDGLEPIIRILESQNVQIYSTGGTQVFIENMGVSVTPVEQITNYPAIFGGRVKTLHPKIFGGILHRRAHKQDEQELKTHEIPSIDMVIVDLYPFEETVASGASQEEIIEKIDIGGIALIRATAKNFKDTLIVSSREQYSDLTDILKQNNAATDIATRTTFATYAFDISSHYDTAIFNYLNDKLPKQKRIASLKQSIRTKKMLRYGENPHQEGVFYGNIDNLFEKLNGKQLSYNNLVDVDAAIHLIDEFPVQEAITFAVLKHTNACGVAFGGSVLEAYQKALQADPVSAFGGVLVSNAPIDEAAAEQLHKLFFEVLIAPDFDKKALDILSQKKNRILLKRKPIQLPSKQVKTLLNGYIMQDKDLQTETETHLKQVTKVSPSKDQIQSLLFAAKLAKHTKSNTIILAKHGQLFASGVGQTSRVDALKQAIHKAQSFGFDLGEAVMASDAFFPFPDCVNIAHEAGIQAVIQPGGSIKDQASIDACDTHQMVMVFTGIRHFKH